MLLEVGQLLDVERVQMSINLRLARGLILDAGLEVLDVQVAWIWGQDVLDVDAPTGLLTHSLNGLDGLLHVLLPGTQRLRMDDIEGKVTHT